MLQLLTLVLAFLTGGFHAAPADSIGGPFTTSNHARHVHAADSIGGPFAAPADSVGGPFAAPADSIGGPVT